MKDMKNKILSYGKTGIRPYSTLLHGLTN